MCTFVKCINIANSEMALVFLFLTVIYLTFWGSYAYIGIFSVISIYSHTSCKIIMKDALIMSCRCMTDSIAG